MVKRAVFAGLGDIYKGSGYDELPFVYKNIADFSSSLKAKGWLTYMSLIDSAATAFNMNEKLMDAVAACTGDDWLLFYYTGHANKYVPVNNYWPTYCVSYVPELRNGYLPPLAQFFSEINYHRVVEAFAQKSRGQLITVMDCCYAAGLVPDIAVGRNFHTVIAAASDKEEAYYTDNSLFFKAFKACWHLPFGTMDAGIQEQLITAPVTTSCQLSVAQPFLQSTF